MSESATESDQQAQATPPEGKQAKAEPKVFDADYVADLRKESAKYRTENKALAERLESIERANESALEKAQREAREATEMAQAATVAALRYRIAAEAGINDNVDLILTAGDEETMRRQAQLWAERATTTTAAGPRPDLTQGGSGAAAALNGDGLEQALKAKLGIA